MDDGSEGEIKQRLEEETAYIAFHIKALALNQGNLLPSSSIPPHVSQKL